MNEPTQHFLRWLMGLTVILRCFVIALLVHVALLFVLATIKAGGMAARALSAAFDPVAPAPLSQADPDPFAAYRDVDYDPPGVKGTPPPKDMMYKVGISQPSAATPTDSQVAEVIGVMSDSATAVARLQGTDGAISAPNFGSADGGMIGVIGGTGAGPWNQRFGPQRTINAAKYQQTQEAERAVLAALRWLKGQQQADGSWATGKGWREKDAYTALAVLCFLGHGHTPDDKEFGDAVNRGVLYLVNTIGSDGICQSTNVYAQGAVTLALAEAYGITQSKAIRDPLERAVAANIAAQKITKKPEHQGGWHYSMTHTTTDTSVSGWVIMGLKSAKLAGIDVPKEVFDQASQYLWNVYDDNGGFGYQAPQRTPTMTAVGVLCQQFMGHYSDPRIKKSLDYLKEQKFNWTSTEGEWVLYGWYYITQAMFQGGGSYWEYWNKQFQGPLIKAQSSDGHWAAPGSSKKEKGYSPVYSTALSCLMLEVFYRYSPLYQEMEKGALRTGPTATK